MSKNLFDYATKELSQDAFLMWLIDSHNSDDDIEKMVSRKFIYFISGISEDEVLKEVWVKPQWCKIDITVFITTNNDKIGIFIEDKTTSDERNQLQKYNESIDKIIKGEKGKLTKIKKIFYKTNTIDEEERNRIKNANWEEISFDFINDFWREFKEINHMIISSYAKHVCSLYEYSKNTSLPIDNNLISWKSFFEKNIVPKIKENVDCFAFITRYGYSCLLVRPKGCGGIEMPYLEIRSRDCLNGSFNARILMYNVDFSKNIDGLNEIRNKIRSIENHIVFSGDYSDKSDKQVAHIKKGKLNQKNKEEFINNVNVAINDYLDIISFWKI